MSDDTPRPYAVEVPLRWGDMDAFGHVNNVEMLRILEQARVQAFLEWFPDEASILDRGVVVARQEIEYLAPLSYRRAPVRVELWISRLAESGFDIGYEVRDPGASGGARYAVAETSMVAFDLGAGRARPLSDEERAVYGRFRGQPVRIRRAGDRPARDAGSEDAAATGQLDGPA